MSGDMFTICHYCGQMFNGSTYCFYVGSAPICQECAHVLGWDGFGINPPPSHASMWVERNLMEWDRNGRPLISRRRW